MKFFVSFAVAALAVVTFGQTVTQGTLTTFDSLAGAKLGAPSTYVRAIDFTNVNRATTVSGITFTGSDFTPNFSAIGSGFAGPVWSPNYGSDTDSLNFKTIMEDVRWANLNPVGGSFTGLTPGQYLLKMYFVENIIAPSASTRRKFDIEINNVRLVTNFVLAGGTSNASYVYELPVTVAPLGNLTAYARNANYAFFDKNPVLSAMTLQSVTPVPEPATMAALGLGIVGLVKRRRK